MTAPWIFAFALLWVLVLLLAFLVLGTLKRVIPLVEQAERSLRGTSIPELGAPVASTISSFKVVDGSGAAVTSAALLRAPVTLVLFMQSGCVGCTELANELRDVTPLLDGVPLVVVVAGANSLDYDLPPSIPIFLDRESEAVSAFSNEATPQLYAVGRDGFVLDRRIPVTAATVVEVVGYQRGGETSS